MEELEEEIKPQKLDDFKELDENLYRQSKKKRNYIILFSNCFYFNLFFCFERA